MTEKTFWAESIAKKIKERKKFHFIDKNIPELFKKKWSVKSSSSLSGVLHIGRLSDIIRGEAVYHALKEAGVKADFIYVTEDMDPLRKIPKNVPEKFKEYIGFPVSDVPDPYGCHDSYREHFLSEFLKVFKDFLLFEPKVYSMREEYKKGNFTELILKLIENKEQLLKIINKYRREPLPENYSIWKPVCENCGNLQTTVITEIKGSKIKYKCQDYKFEKYTAKGCGFEGETDIRKGNGKLIWKSEWAAQWLRWNVASEGAGKEYIAPNSAFWINAEIAEKILDFPAPEPIFYEHLIIEGTKMSASLGNVVYPKDWLEVARAESLRLLYLKKLMKTRSFSWKNIPMIELEVDRIIQTVKETAKKKENTIEELTAKKFFEYIKVKNHELIQLNTDYALIVSLAQLFPDNNQLISKLIELKQLNKKPTGKELNALNERIIHARNWIKKYASEEEKLSFTVEVKEKKNVDNETAKALNELIKALNEEMQAEKIQQLIYETAKKHGLALKDFFKLFYEIILEKEKGPRLGTLIKALGVNKIKEKIINSIEKNQ